MNKKLYFVLFALFLSSPVYAVCVDTSVIIQLDVHAQGAGQSQQNASAQQQQDPNCFNNRHTSVITQTHIGHHAARQNATSSSQQSTPAGQNPLTALGVKTDNIKTNVIIQEEVLIPNAAALKSAIRY